MLDIPPPKQPENPPLLGIYAERSSNPVTARVTADGELMDIPRDSRTARAERFALKSAAGRLLPQDHRSTRCMRWRVPNQQIQVLLGSVTGRAFYHGLQVCAMPWTCPVCASKISERRRVEVAHAMQQAEALGLRVILLTLTIPHGLGDDVRDICGRMLHANRRMWDGRQGGILRRMLGHFGHIRALEVTHGANGFHPHLHILVFYHPDQVQPGTWEALPSVWQRCARLAGLPEPQQPYGCQIDDGTKAAAYVAKGVWGLESELTKGIVKDAKNGSRTMYRLLKDYMAGDRKAGAIWSVYADAFKGRRMLVWSKGFKRLLGQAELSDDEIANKPDDQVARLLSVITDDQWQTIWRRNLQSAVLDLAEVIEHDETGQTALSRFLAELSQLERKAA